MTGIPKDILIVARDTAGIIISNCSRNIAGPIAEAIFEERERCAKIAAAPELLDALISADGLLRELGHSLPNVKAAIAKARAEP